MQNHYDIHRGNDLMLATTLGAMPSYRVIFWDLDGTIIDPKEGILSSVRYALEKLGIEGVNDKFLSQFIGPPLHRSFEELIGLNESESKTAVEYYRENFSGNKAMFKDRLYEGVYALLHELKSKDFRQLIVTSKPAVFAEQIAEFHGIRGCFTEVIGSRLDGSRTLKSDLMKDAMELFPNSGKSEIVAIGDRKFEILAAREVGIDSIAVSYGYGSKEEIAGSSPNYIADTVQDLESIFLH